MKPHTAEEAIHQIPIQLLVPASFNPRRTLTPASTAELASSIREHGVTPLIVRPWGTPNGSKFAKQHYEIISGHRRLEAARQLDLDEVPCIVRMLDDAHAAELAVVENLQREDVPALEEADAYKELEQRLGTAAAIAARVGKDVSYVARRLQLVSLAPMPRKALAERLITVDHALLLARLGSDEQDANLKWTLRTSAGMRETVEKIFDECLKERDRAAGSRHFGYWQPQSVLNLKQHIEQNAGRRLSRAPWDLEDPNLSPEAGACSVCPSNTKANDTLFGDMAIAAATCENGACFERKREAFVQIRLGSAGSGSEVPAFKLSWKTTTVKPRVAKSEALNVDGFNSLQTFKYGQWIDAKKGSCEYIHLGVTIDWSDANDRGYMGSDKKLQKPGQVLTVCIAENCKIHKKGHAQPDRKGNGQRFDAKADEQNREQKRQAAIAETKIRVFVVGEALKSLTTIPAEALRALVLERAPGWGQELKIAEALLPGFAKTIKSGQVDSEAFAKAAAICSLQSIEASDYEDLSKSRVEFLKEVKRLGYNGASAWDQPAKAELDAKVARTAGGKKPSLSAEAKKRIADAQRKRWAAAKVKKAGKK